MRPVCRPVIRPSSINFVFDGNSLVAGNGSSVPLPAQLAALAPLSLYSVPVVNRGISGQSTRMMNGLDGGSSSDVDSAWVSGKTNILFVWEGTNTVFNTARTGLQAASDMTDYIAVRQSSHPWVVVLLTTIPRDQDSMTEYQQIAANGELNVYDAYLKSNYKTMGAQRVVDVRQAGSPFITTTYTKAAMATLASSGLWMSGDYSGHIHLNDAGYAVIAGYCADAIQKIRLR